MSKDEQQELEIKLKEYRIKEENMAANYRKYSQEYVDNLINEFRKEINSLNIEKFEWKELALDLVKEQSEERLISWIPSMFSIIARERGKVAILEVELAALKSSIRY